MPGCVELHGGTVSDKLMNTVEPLAAKDPDSSSFGGGGGVGGSGRPLAHPSNEGNEMTGSHHLPTLHSFR